MLFSFMFAFVMGHVFMDHTVPKVLFSILFLWVWSFPSALSQAFQISFHDFALCFDSSQWLTQKELGNGVSMFARLSKTLHCKYVHLKTFWMVLIETVNSITTEYASKLFQQSDFWNWTEAEWIATPPVPTWSANKGRLVWGSGLKILLWKLCGTVGTENSKSWNAAEKIYGEK